MSSPRNWCLALVALGAVNTVQAQQAGGSTLWHRLENDQSNIPRFHLDSSELENRLTQYLWPGQADSDASANTNRCVVELPMPDGSLHSFYVGDSGVMPDALRQRFPNIRSCRGESIENPQISVRFNFCPNGLRAQVFQSTETIHIFPPHGWNGAYVSVRKSDLSSNTHFQCATSLTAPEDDLPELANLGQQRGGRQLRTYRVAIAASGEFTRATGGTVQSALSTIVTTINHVNGIYERELGIRLQLVPNNDQIIFTNPDTDPYSANQATATTLLENQAAIDSIIGSANYDIGHLFNTAEFGLAYIGVVCREEWKARGCIGTSTPGAELFFGDYAAHEIAHQFGAHHTFNSLDGNCFGGRNAVAAYEPGSGSTLMGYAGFCGNDNLQPHVNAYFHSASYDEIQQFVSSGSGSCAIVTPTGNNPPLVDTAPQIVVPRETPFRLVATGQDPDGDLLTYCWEQRDLGPAQNVYESDNGQGPLFRSFEPVASPIRTFPRMEELLNNWRLKGEQLPRVPRDLHFRVTARDNRGGIGTADTVVTVANAGPFRVTSHNGGASYSGVQTITWDVAGTTAAPLNTTHVNILLSTNGGTNFNLVLAAGTPNDGSEQVLFPNENIQGARLRVEAANQTYFALNDGPFNIERYYDVPDFNFDQNADLVWHNSNGQVAAWHLDGTNFLGASLLRDGISVPAHWRLAAIADFNHDAQADLLWHHLDGRLTVWFMNGTEFIAAQPLREGKPLGAGWRIVSATDMDGDIQPDILMHRNNGKLAVWKMNGTELVQAIELRGGLTVPLHWKALGVSDFNADGHKDIVFRHDDGRISVWLMNGFEFVENHLLDTPRPDHSWQFGALVDLDRNGQNDFIWKHADGRIRVWFMSGMSAINYGTLRNGRTGIHWKLSGPR